MNFLEFIDKLPQEDRQLVIDHFVKNLIGQQSQEEVVIRRTATISTLGIEEEIIQEISQIFNVPVEEIKKQNIANKLKEITAGYHKTSSGIDKYKEFLTNNNAPKDKFEELYDIGKFLVSLNMSCTLEIPTHISAVPDFTVITDSKRIGIEHTRVMNSKSQMLVKTTIYILKKAETILLQKNPRLKQIVNVSINYWKVSINDRSLSLKLTIQENDQIAMAIADYIGSVLNNAIANKPEYIDSVSVSNRSEHPLTIVLNENYIAKPEFKNLFEERIKSKETKLASYAKNKSLDELWLVVVISGVTASSSYIPANLNKFDTRFDKVFLFDNFSHDYLLLHPTE